jgi:hypothetical protein
MPGYRQEMRRLMAHIPNMEEPELTANQKLILEYLSTKRKPQLAKDISKKLCIGYNTTRARLHELMKLGFIYQPMKEEQLLSENSFIAFHTASEKKCGYSILKLRA